MKTPTFGSVLLAVFILRSDLSAQQRESAEPLHLATVIALLENNGFSEDERRWIVETKCITFHVDEVTTPILTKAGASPALLAAARNACYRERAPGFDFDFTNSQRLPLIADGPTCIHTYADGGYRIEPSTEACYSPVENYSGGAVKLTAQFKVRGAGPGSTVSDVYGSLAFGVKPDGSENMFLLNGGRFEVLRWSDTDQKYTVVVPYTIAPSARSALDSINQLDIEIRGDQAMFFVNGTAVANIAFSDGIPNRAAFGAGYGVVVFTKFSAIPLAP